MPKDALELLEGFLNLECTMKGGLRPTHILAVSKQVFGDPPAADENGAQHPLLVPIDEGRWKEKTLTPLPPSLPQNSKSWVITLPIIPIDAPHPDYVPLLLLFALGLEPMLGLFARQLLPPEVVGEFPDASAMTYRMARELDSTGIQEYLVRNRQLWRNSLRLGIMDKHIIEMIEISHKVTVRAQEKRRSRTPPVILVVGAN